MQWPFHHRTCSGIPLCAYFVEKPSAETGQTFSKPIFQGCFKLAQAINCGPHLLIARLFRWNNIQRPRSKIHLQLALFLSNNRLAQLLDGLFVRGREV